MTERPTKITFGEMREMGVPGLLVYCADYRCSHSIAINGDCWPDDVRLSDIELATIQRGVTKKTGKARKLGYCNDVTERWTQK